MNWWLVGAFAAVAVGSFGALVWLVHHSHKDTPVERPGSDDQWSTFPVIHNPALRDQLSQDRGEASE
jgi:hypothetical protein